MSPKSKETEKGICQQRKKRIGKTADESYQGIFGKEKSEAR